MNVDLSTPPALARVLAVALLLVTPAGGAAQPAETAGGDGTAPVFRVDAVNPGLQPRGDLDLETPQACVEHFVLAAREGAWRRAADALDFRLLGPVDDRRAAELARRFFFVLNQELWINWDELPDRPDGVLEESYGSNDPLAGQPRRSIRLGSISVDGRSVPVHVHRLQPPTGDPRWLFSAHTVDNIPALWEAHGPSWIARRMPEWARERGPGRIHVWQWIGLLLTLGFAPLAGRLLGKHLTRFVTRRFDGAASKLFDELEWPMTTVVATLVLWLSLRFVLGLPSAIATVLEPLSLILVVASFVWLAMRTATFFIDRVVKEAVRDVHDEESASRKRLLTQITVGRHVVLLMLALIGVAIVLLQLDSFRSVGITMLSSAGAAAVVLGIAGHAVLGNLIAGLQIALAQPFRIGDSVYVENNWGQIEDISYVDVTVKTWDDRRLVFPIRYFVTNWFENWSKTDPFLTKPIYLQVDYAADVERIRDQFLEFVREDEDWAADQDEPQCLVTECGDETMTVRLTCGGPDVGAAWRLSCRVRERMLGWLQQVEGGAWLPRRRLVLAERVTGEVAAPEREREAVSA